jgi:hypothetical protein
MGETSKKQLRRGYYVSKDRLLKEKTCNRPVLPCQIGRIAFPRKPDKLLPINAFAPIFRFWHKNCSYDR